MATDYAGAVRNGAMAAARLHVEFDTKAKMQGQGGNIDVFDAVLGVKLPLLLRPSRDYSARIFRTRSQAFL
jgi:hypothetical protein